MSKKKKTRKGPRNHPRSSNTYNASLGRMADDYMERFVNHLMSILRSGDQEAVQQGIKDALKWLNRIHEREMLIISKLSPAIKDAAIRLGQDPKNFESIQSESDEEADSLSEQRTLADVIKLIDQVKSETDGAGREFLALTDNQEEIDRFNAMSKPIGRRLIILGEMGDKLAELDNWLQTSPDAKWVQALQMARDSVEGDTQSSL